MPLSKGSVLCKFWCTKGNPLWHLPASSLQPFHLNCLLLILLMESVHEAGEPQLLQRIVKEVEVHVLHSEQSRKDNTDRVWLGIGGEVGQFVKHRAHDLQPGHFVVGVQMLSAAL